MRTRSWALLGVVGCAGILGFVACGSSDDSSFPGGNGDDGGGSGLTDGSGTFGEGGFGGADSGPTKPVDSLVIDPATATLDVSSAPFPTKKFTVTAHYTDGTTGVVGASWTASSAPVGHIDGSGLYFTSGGQGGAVVVTATAGGKSATANVTVVLHETANTIGADAATQAALLAAEASATTDPGVTWTYPYDGMAYTRGLNAPEMMWNGGAAGDVYAIHIKSATYELQAFSAGKAVTSVAPGVTPAGAFAFDYDGANWAKFAASTSGAATVTVMRKHGSSYTKLVGQTWKMASRSMSGTIYYWAINKAAVVRIKPGATVPDFFLSGATVPPPGEQNGSGTVTTQMFCPSCHTASADGSTLAMGTGLWGTSVDVWSTLYDLNAGATTFHGYQTSSPATRYPLCALTPDGKILVENWATVRGGAMGKDDVPVDISAPSGTTGKLMPSTDLDTLVGAGKHTFFPVFSADNALFAYVDSGNGDLISLAWNPTTKKFSSPVTLATGAAAGGKIAYPTISPDHRWVVYQVGPDYGSLSTSDLGDLWAVDTTNPLHPISLAGINTTKSAAASDARDLHRSYEPTFAPVASGGYFWLVFHSRRTYGNRLVDVPYVNGTEGSGTKQLRRPIRATRRSGSPVRTRRRATCAAIGRSTRAMPTA